MDKPTRSDFQAVVRTAIYTEVAERIRAKILDRSMSAGAALPPERELARQFGVSRTTVREALRQLQAQGLLAPRGRTSPLEAATPDAADAHFRESLTRAVQLREVSLADLLELRVALESAAIPRAAVAPVAIQLDAARAALAEMEMANVSWERFHSADVAFHVALVAASGNQALLLVMQSAKDAIALHLDETMRGRSFPKVRKRIVQEHRELLEAIERGDIAGATERLRAHVGEFYGS
jgi:GntR family transcriptional regulator, transcriptional repressor for pyruvate dehydrogenase complex